MDGLIERIVKATDQAERVVVLTGAGVSKESGIPTFRDALTGLWANYEPEKLATPEGFLADPPLVWRWYDERRAQLKEVQPNPGHYAIAELERLVPRLVVITQNIDGLHANAGSTDVLELHGNITRYYCFERRHPAADVPFGLSEPPLCQCGSLLRPGVVWFGEALPGDVLERAAQECTQADVAFVVGTSGIVQPAASLPFVARQAGAFVVEVNPEPTPITNICDVFLQGPSGEMLPKVIDALRAARTQAGR